MSIPEELQPHAWNAEYAAWQRFSMNGRVKQGPREYHQAGFETGVLWLLERLTGAKEGQEIVTVKPKPGKVLYDDEYGHYFAPVACPRCGAEVGERCRTSKGKPFLKSYGMEEGYGSACHIARWRAGAEWHNHASPRTLQLNAMRWALTVCGGDTSAARSALEHIIKLWERPEHRDWDEQMRDAEPGDIPNAKIVDGEVRYFDSRTGEPIEPPPRWCDGSAAQAPGRGPAGDA